VNGQGFLSSVVADSRERRPVRPSRSADDTGVTEPVRVADAVTGVHGPRSADAGSPPSVPVPDLTREGDARTVGEPARRPPPSEASRTVDGDGGARPASGPTVASPAVAAPSAADRPPTTRVRSAGAEAAHVAGPAEADAPDPRDAAEPVPSASGAAAPPSPAARPDRDPAAPPGVTSPVVADPDREEPVATTDPGGHASVQRLSRATGDVVVPQEARELGLRRAPRDVDAPNAARRPVGGDATTATHPAASTRTRSAPRATPHTATLVGAAPVDRPPPSGSPSGVPSEARQAPEADRGEPTVSIGVVEVVVTAPDPVPAPRSSPIPASPSGEASRCYLRGL
jgi:hypothetical protein